MPHILYQYSFTALLILSSLLTGFLPQQALADSIRQNTIISDQVDVDIQQYPAEGKSMIVWIAPDFGFRKSHQEMAELLSKKGLEIWMVDLNEALFLPRGSKAMREIDAKYVADMINVAAQKTAKNVILMSSFYGAIPVLEGARHWQLNSPDSRSLQAAILFSPALYMGVPKLGDDPQFVPIVAHTNIPIIIFQGGDHASRWQVGNLLDRLHDAGSAAYATIMPDITSLYYGDERSKSQQAYFDTVPDRINQLVNILDPLPVKAVTDKPTDIESPVNNIDISLRPYRGKVKPMPFELLDMHNDLQRIDKFEGKVTILNFWATWCPPCVEEIPSLNRLQKIMNHPDFRLVSINFAEDTETISEFTKEVEVEFPVLMDESGEVSRDWKILVLPSTYVIGPDGEIAYGVNAAINWDSPQAVQQLKKLLSSKPTSK
jgi:thiol-disulfide isomerase/thioredoxin